MAFSDSLIVTERYTEPEDPEARLAWRRELVVQKMRDMAALVWTPAEDITYQCQDNTWQLKKGELYLGMPYAHGSGSGMSFMTFVTSRDENGICTVEGLEGPRLGGTGSVPHISNDCADMLFWAWGAVSNSISFKLTKHMTPLNGCIPVGDYTLGVTSYRGATTAIIEENGVEVMLESYAGLQKGDGMVRNSETNAGHAVMVTQVNTVRREDGTIDPDASFVLILEQTSGNVKKEEVVFDEKLGRDIHVFCGVDRQWSYRYLLEKGYLPVTCQELIDPTPLEEEIIEDSLQEFTKKEILSGTLKSNYRISHVVVTIFDESGKELRRDTGFVTEDSMNKFKLSSLRGGLAQLSRGELELDTLAPGVYRCVTTCTVSTGRTVTVRDFLFTVE